MHSVVTDNSDHTNPPCLPRARVLDVNSDCQRSMPSKNAKHKARRVAKSRKKEELLRDDSATNEIENDVDSQMQRLQISSNKDQDNEDALLEEAINLASAEREQLEAAARYDEGNSSDVCDHGFVPFPRGHVCGRFVRSFLREFTSIDKNNLIFDHAFFKNARQATKNWEVVMMNPDLVQQVVSYFLAEGAGAILEEKDDRARQSRMFTIMFENYRNVMTCNTEVQRKCNKIGELSSESCDEHTLVSFFRKRIPCKCLNKRYKQVKSIVKMGSCCNPGCPLPDGKTEYSKLMHCEQCLSVHYCSIECQKANWQSHKEFCVIMSKLP